MASFRKIRVPRGAAPQFSHNALRPMAKAGFSDAIAEKLLQADQGVVRTKIARNMRVKGLTRRKVLHAIGTMLRIGLGAKPRRKSSRR
jgi:hypothetical protein